MIFLFAILVSTTIPKIFFTPSAQPSMVVRISLPIGSTIDEALKTVKEMEHYLESKCPEFIENYTCFVGKGAPRFWINNTPVPDSDEYAEILVNAVSLEAYEEIRPQIELFGFNHFSNTEVSVKKLDNGPPVTTPVQIRISGENIEYISERAEALKNGFTAFDVKKAVEPWLKKQEWEIGCRYEFGGEVESSNEAQGAVSDKLHASPKVCIILREVSFSSTITISRRFKYGNCRKE